MPRRILCSIKRNKQPIKSITRCIIRYIKTEIALIVVCALVAIGIAAVVTLMIIKLRPNMCTHGNNADDIHEDNNDAGDTNL